MLKKRNPTNKMDGIIRHRTAGTYSFCPRLMSRGWNVKRTYPSPRHQGIRLHHRQLGHHHRHGQLCLWRQQRGRILLSALSCKSIPYWPHMVYGFVFLNPVKGKFIVICGGHFRRFLILLLQLNVGNGFMEEKSLNTLLSVL